MNAAVDLQSRNFAVYAVRQFLHGRDRASENKVYRPEIQNMAQKIAIPKHEPAAPVGELAYESPANHWLKACGNARTLTEGSSISYYYPSI